MPTKLLPSGQRRKRFKLYKHAPNLKITSRDEQILLGLYHHRFLNSHLIRDMLGETADDHLFRRLRLFFDHGLIDRPRAQIAGLALGNRPMVYALCDKGYAYLKSRHLVTGTESRWRERNANVGLHFIDHVLETAQFHIRLEQAIEEQTELRFLGAEDCLGQGTKLSTFKWPTQITWTDGKAHCFKLAPDGVFGIADQITETMSYFFLELDRGTEPIVRGQSSQSSILRKMLSYADTHRNDLIGLPNFRVLFATTTDARIAAMQDAYLTHVKPLASPGLFLFSTLEQAVHDPLGEIWRDGKSRPAQLVSDIDGQ